MGAGSSLSLHPGIYAVLLTEDGRDIGSRIHCVTSAQKVFESVVSPGHRQTWLSVWIEFIEELRCQRLGARVSEAETISGFEKTAPVEDCC